MTAIPELTPDEVLALWGHLEAHPERLHQAIREGETLGHVVTRWRADRDAAARAKEITAELADQVLALPIGDGYWSRDGATIRDYLTELLAKFWEGEADGRYGMVGQSDWRYDVYGALSRAGIIPGWKQGYGVGYREDGSCDPRDVRRADRIVEAAIRRMAGE